jgi:AcrR family transcriptional regulator
LLRCPIRWWSQQSGNLPKAFERNLVSETYSRFSPLRGRLLSAAHDLFRRSGIRGVGVDAIAEAAGTNKMTLYRHFESKDDLIVAYLREVEAEGDAMWESIEKEHPGDGAAQLESWLSRANECITEDGRGCELANAAVELTEDNHPARRLIEEIKTAHRDRLVKLCRNAGVAAPALLADTLTLLLEGARANRQAAGTKGPSASFVTMARNIIEASKRKPGAGDRTARRK